MRFLFCLDLNLHAGAGKKNGILIFVTEHGLVTSQNAPSSPVQEASIHNIIHKFK